jgi:5'-AMP-activated protein kinase, regulatory gamma subunit
MYLISFFLHTVEQMVSAVPIVNDDGVMIGVLSSNDLRTLITEPAKFATMAKPIREFPHSHVKGLDIISAKPDSTLADVIKLFQAFHVHRVFILNDAKKPIGVISLRDVLSKFVKQPTDNFQLAQYFSARTWQTMC